MMDEFKQLDTNHYVCYTVLNRLWDREAKKYVDKKLIVFDNEGDANKCFAILEEYKGLCRSTLLMTNTLAKDVIIFDGATFHLMSGRKVEYEQYARNKQAVQKIERSFPERSWGYMDEYARLFGYKARRPRSILGSLLCCCCCFWVCTNDVCTYAL